MAADAPTPSLAPYLFYQDVAAASRFMQEAFGFRLVFESPCRSRQSPATK